MIMAKILLLKILADKNMSRESIENKVFLAIMEIDGVNQALNAMSKSATKNNGTFIGFKEDQGRWLFRETDRFSECVNP